MPKERDQKMNRDERGAKIFIKGKKEKKTTDLRRRFEKEND